MHLPLPSMVLGMDGTKKILEQHPELLAYLIYSDAQREKQSMVFSIHEKDFSRIA